MTTRRAMIGAAAVACALVAAQVAGAKEFRPGDLRVCSPAGCVSIVKRSVLPSLFTFFYAGPRPLTAVPPRLGAPYYEVWFRDDQKLGVVSTKELDRFLSYGVDTERFTARVWYRVPLSVSTEIRRIAGKLKPFRLTQAAIDASR